MKTESERASATAAPNPAITVYCLAALLAEEARAAGCDDFARCIEAGLERLASALPRSERRQALMLALAFVTAGDAERPDGPRLRLVHSRA